MTDSFLVVDQAFAGYRRGDAITDSTAMTAILGSDSARFVVPVSTGTAQPFQLISSLTSYASNPAVPKPAYLTPFTDPVFGTKITRISGDAGTPIANLSGGIWRHSNVHRPSRPRPRLPPQGALGPASQAAQINV